MHLNRKVVAGVDELHEQRKFRAEAFKIGSSDQFFALFGHEFVEFPTGFWSFAHDSLVAFHATNLPTLADFPQRGLNVLEGRNFRAAPNRIL